MRIAVSEKRKKYDREFRGGVVRIVEETGRPVAQIARGFGVSAGILGNWVNRACEAAQGSGGCRRTTWRNSSGWVLRSASSGWSVVSSSDLWSCG